MARARHGLARTSLLIATLLAGCQPLASFRPANGLMADRDVEVGFGAVALSSKPEAVRQRYSASGQLWWSADAADWLMLTGVLALGETSRPPRTALSAGIAARALVLRTDRFAGGLEGELGWAFGALSLALSVRLFDETWIYAGPRIGTFGDEIAVGLPAGVSVHVYDGLFLRVEARWAWPGFDPFERRFHLGAAIAAQL